MKTIIDLMLLQAEAIQNNREDYKTWFFNYSGHVNQMSARFYLTGWGEDKACEELSVELNEEGIQAMYWFIKTRG